MMDIPFTWAAETTAAEFDGEACKLFLLSHGVYGEGLWKRDSGPDWILHPFGELSCDDFVLPSESAILDAVPDSISSQILSSPITLDIISSREVSLRLENQPITAVVLSTNGPIRSWSEYYTWRGFRFDSPICILLQWPLTLYHVIICLHSDYGKPVKSSDYGITGLGEFRRSLCIHIIGAEKEADLLITFLELRNLLSSTYDLDLHLIGPLISRRLDRKSIGAERMTLTLHHGLYHNIVERLPTPTLVIGFNAGLAAYTDWVETIDTLAIRRTPAYFTDYSYESFEFTRQQINKRRERRTETRTITDQLKEPLTKARNKRIEQRARTEDKRRKLLTSGVMKRCRDTEEVTSMLSKLTSKNTISGLITDGAVGSTTCCDVTSANTGNSTSSTCHNIGCTHSTTKTEKHVAKKLNLETSLTLPEGEIHGGERVIHGGGGEGITGMQVAEEGGSGLGGEKKHEGVRRESIVRVHVSEAVLNPFRGPLRVSGERRRSCVKRGESYRQRGGPCVEGGGSYGESKELAQFSNAVLFHLVYDADDDRIS